MGLSTIPVDLHNPGQVFACMGFLEATEQLCGYATGRFHWNDEHDPSGHFHLECEANRNPVSDVLEFISKASIYQCVPDGWTHGKASSSNLFVTGNEFPSREPNETSLPIVLKSEKNQIYLWHWADGSSRDAFKLYSGNRSAYSIASLQIGGKLTGKARKIEIPGIVHLWHNQREELILDPLGITIPVAGTFNMDARCAWSAIDAGYSPNDHNQRVAGSPVVELMAALGLQNARPHLIDRRHYRYAAWTDELPPVLARPMLAGSVGAYDCRRFSFRLEMSGKNKIVLYSEEEN